jgi:hypothetical protein
MHLIDLEKAQYNDASELYRIQSNLFQMPHISSTKIEPDSVVSELLSRLFVYRDERRVYSTTALKFEIVN